MSHRPALQALLSCILGLSWTGHVQSAQAAEDSLEIQVEKLLAQEGRVLAALDELDRKVQELRTRKDELAAQQLSMSADLHRQNQTLENTRRELETLQSRVQKRLRVRSNLDLEEAHRRRLLFAAGGQNDWMRRRGYLAAIVRGDLQLIQRYKRLDGSLKNRVSKRQVALAALREQDEKLEAKRIDYRREKKIRQAALNALKSRQSLLRELLVEQADRRRALRLASAAGGGLKGDGIIRKRGLLIHPTPHRIVKRFGVIKDLETGASLQSNGWTYRGPLGSPVQAVFSGIVVYSGWYMGFGQLLMIDHGEGHHSLYAHLDTLDKVKGDRVKQGEIVGQLGDTGSLRGPQLYFEFRKNRKPDDPARWLLRRP